LDGKQEIYGCMYTDEVASWCLLLDLCRFCWWNLFQSCRYTGPTKLAQQPTTFCVSLSVLVTCWVPTFILYTFQLTPVHKYVVLRKITLFSFCCFAAGEFFTENFGQ